MDLDLQHVLDATRKGQWSVHSFDWDEPLQGATHLNRRERQEAGLALLFTAGLEKQAAKIFALCAKHVDDPTAKQIYELFVRDETRHAEAEIRLARRLGVGWKDLPLPTRAFFKGLGGGWLGYGPLMYEATSSVIILFELALDSILVSTLKEQIDDPLQKEIFSLIDRDESRHLAMDYWLLDRRGAEQARPSWLSLSSRMVQFAAKVGPPAPMGIAAFLGRTRSLLGSIRVTDLQKYWNRFEAVPDKAPHAMSEPIYRASAASLSSAVKFFVDHPRLRNRIFGAEIGAEHD